MNLKQKIKKLFSDGKAAFVTQNNIYSLLKLNPAEKTQAKRALKDLEAEGELIKDTFGAYSTPSQIGALKGIIQANERGFAFLLPEDRQSFPNDFFIPKRSLKGALDGDKVLAARVKGTDDEAFVVKILERGKSRVSGTFEKHGKAAYVIPDKANFAPRIFIPSALCYGAKNGHKVVCEITSYPQGKAPNGKVIEILGRSGDFYAEELSIIRNYGLYESFAPDVKKQAERVAAQRIELNGRRDLRSQTIITIDGEDTRDIDDAVCVEKRGENYLLGVHIADVGHYVQYGTALDKEAYNRATSVYFPDSVLPMLPKALSNGACSLNEGEDRYALSVVAEISPQGEILNSEIFESVINSAHRTTYKEIESIISGDENAPERLADIKNMCLMMKKLSDILEARRRRLGNIDLSVKEAKIYVDERGEIVIPDYKRLNSEKIIEQFMICANEAVARRMSALKAPFMYRIHEPPEPEKVENFNEFLKDIGAGFTMPEEPQPKDFSVALARLEDKPYFDAVNKVMLRTMQKARYCEKNLGHFGIASGCYCHFTSPIRRYPDLFIHRIIKLYLRGEGEKANKLYEANAAKYAAHCSICERNADAAEREVDDLYKLVYISDREGQVFDAKVSGVTSKGIFAELENTVEGFIEIEKLPLDSYEYFENLFALKGRKHSFRLGDRLKVRVDGCDWGNMRAEFSVVQ